MKWHEHRPKKWQKQIVINKMKKWNDINLSQQKVGKTKSAKTWVTRNIEVAYLNFTWKILKGKIGLKDVTE
jgi:hypothetical protein